MSSVSGNTIKRFRIEMQDFITVHPGVNSTSLKKASEWLCLGEQITICYYGQIIHISWQISNFFQNSLKILKIFYFDSILAKPFVSFAGTLYYYVQVTYCCDCFLQVPDRFMKVWRRSTELRVSKIFSWNCRHKRRMSSKYFKKL